MNPVIIECAINGVTPKVTNPHVPIEPPACIIELQIFSLSSGSMA